MSKTADLEARAAAVTARPEPAPAAAVPPRVRPVKMTVDLSPEQYRQVKAYPDAMGLPEATGKAKIATVEVFRALLEELAVNAELREHVATRIRANVSS